MELVLVAKKTGYLHLISFWKPLTVETDIILLEVWGAPVIQKFWQSQSFIVALHKFSIICRRIDKDNF